RVFTVAASAGAVAAPLNAVARMHRLDTLALVQATLTRSARALDGWANEMDVLPATLSAVMGVAVTPLLQAVRRAWADRVPVGWGHGYCPVCGEWVALAEALDLDHSRRLRCGECGSDWRGAWLRCAFCANTDHTTLALFTPDAALATRSIETCAVCGGYVKVLATLQAAAPEAVALLDLATVELDIVAVEQGYARPRAPASVLHVSVVPARR
ncbi:MAG TPA: formate dehydrogenase accessory protein FdhE, partial [Dongiaceae bacterium]|nr:formate dehydrogenase accessory protein FdhE [Dongiaceae bacterium]